jgi:hypothetical protein
MYNINQTSTIEELREFYVPAFHHPIKMGSKRLYTLSVPLFNKEIQIKKSSKKIKHTSFQNVILGAVRRMNKLFAPDKLRLEVIINKIPNENDLTLEFELINRNLFVISNEEYFLTIVARYSYNKPDKVTYFPILYRQWCSNGCVSILSEQFKEVIDAEKIHDIGCEWTRCNFESYRNRLNNYFNYLKSQINHSEQLRLSTNKIASKLFDLSNSTKINRDNFINPEFKGDNRNIDLYFGRNIEQLGNNQFAVLNALTEFASREKDSDQRYKYFMALGKYIDKEINKTIKLENQFGFSRLSWEELNRLYN